MKKLLSILMALILLIGTCPAMADGVTTAPAFTTVEGGEIMGTLRDGVYHFLGIPYGTAERFEQPQKVAAWEGVLNCLVLGEVCPQDRTLDDYAVNSHEFMTPAGNDMVASESKCLNLNVWTSALEGSKPVIVFEHGGGLTNGSSHELTYYNGSYMAKEDDVVFVSVNARLNYLGYLDVSAYGDETYANSGNCGLADMVLALEWVRDNIAAFGGDPSNVTIIGQSGGVTKVTSLASLPAADGLFNKVVAMSGGYSSTTKETRLENTAKLVDYLSLTAEDDVIAILKAMSYDELYKACSAAGVSAAPTIGGEYYPEPWYNAENGKLNEYAAKRSYMIGGTFAEFSSNGEALTSGTTLDISDVYKPGLTEEKRAEMLSERYGDKADAIVEAFLKAYPDHDAVDMLWMNNRTATFGGLPLTNYCAENGITVYNYTVGYAFPYFGGVMMHHSGDIGFWFRAIDTIGYQIAGDEEAAMKVADEMASALAAFAATGDPSTETLGWPAYTTDNHVTMLFDRNSKAEADFDAELLALLNAQ